MIEIINKIARIIMLLLGLFMLVIGIIHFIAPKWYHDFYPGFEGGQMPLIRKIPKRGFRNRRPIRYQIVNLRDLGRVDDNLITPEVLEKNRLIKDKDKPVKILGQGAIDKPITLKGLSLSSGAKTKIQQAGGKCSLH